MKNKALFKLISALLLVVLLFTLASCSALEAPVGIAKAEINGDGELVLTYTDGTSKNLGVVVGKDGVDGVNGVDGKDGTNGKDGVNGTNGKDGKNGKDGINGADGTDGSCVVSDRDKIVEAASSKALTSSVSIFCGFKSTYYGQTQEYASAGAGVIYRMNKALGEAFIITNYHVVYDPNSDTSDGISDEIYVYLYGSELEAQAMSAEYVGGSLAYDIAVLRISDSDILKNSNASPASIFNSDEINVGESAIAIGNPEGMGISTSLGIVSVDSEYIEMLGADEETAVKFRVMRIDTAVNSGNSGGGLFNSDGKLIGIVNAKVQSDTVENIAYAIPSNLATAVADNIIYYCLDTNVYQPQKPVLGIMIQVSDSHAEYDSEASRIKIVEKITVMSTEIGGAAYGILEEGDVLKSASYGDVNVEITRLHSVDFLLNVRAGETVKFVVERGGVEQTLEITIKASDLVAS